MAMTELVQYDNDLPKILGQFFGRLSRGNVFSIIEGENYNLINVSQSIQLLG